MCRLTSLSAPECGSLSFASLLADYTQQMHSGASNCAGRHLPCYETRAHRKVRDAYEFDSYFYETPTFHSSGPIYGRVPKCYQIIGRGANFRTSFRGVRRGPAFFALSSRNSHRPSEPPTGRIAQHNAASEMSFSPL